MRQLSSFNGKIPKIPLVIVALACGVFGAYIIFSSKAAVACTTTVSSVSSAQNAVSSASGGSTVCMSSGNYGSITFQGVAPSSPVIFQPAPGATVHINDITLNGPGNTKNLTVQGFYIDGGVMGLCGIDGNVIFQYNTIQHINAGNAFYFYANGCGGSHVQTGISMVHNQMDHVGECLTVAGGAGIEKNFTFKNNVCGPNIGAGVTRGNQYSHYIEIGCMDGGIFDNNAFIGPYDATALSNSDPATAVHNNVFHCFGDGSNISFSNNILWHTQSRAQTVLVQSGKMDNITIHNNLFVNDPACRVSSNNCPAQDIEVYATHGLDVTNNTIVATAWGLHFPSVCTDGCYASGTDNNLSNNIVEAAASDGNADYSEWGCASNCVTSQNVSYDSSAVGSSSVKNWTPSYTTTNWTPHDGEPYSSPPNGYYVAKGLSFAAGWDGTGGPQDGVGAIAFESSGSTVSDTTKPTVSITAPANSATVSGSSVAVSATASDDTGVVGVQFKLDGNNLGSEDTSSPYSTTWNTTSTSNGSHILTAIARDAAGNTKTSTSVSVTVGNSSGGTGTVISTSSTPPLKTYDCVAGATNVTTAAQVRSAVQSNQNVCVTAAVGNVDLSELGTRKVTITSKGSGSIGNVLIKDTTDLTLRSVRMRSAELRFADRTVIEDSVLGGTQSSRVDDQIIFMPEESNDVTVQDNDIGWTIADNSGNTGYGCRCYGAVNNLHFVGNKVHDIAADGFQGTNGSNVLIDRNEIGPVGANPSSNEHSDNIQVVYNEANMKITNNWIHHQGFYNGNVTGNSGSTYIHGGTSNSLLYENNLVQTNQGRTEVCGLGTGGTSRSNITLRNNTWVDGGLTFDNFPGFEWDCDSGSGNTVANNIAVDPDGGFAQDGSASAATFSNNLWGQPSLVTLNAQGECTSANCNPSGQTAIGYRCPTDVWWCTPGSTGSPADTTNPTVSFSSPANNATVSGVVTAAVNAADNVGVSKVEISLDGSLKLTDTQSPYNYSFDSKTISNGSHTLSAKAYDAAGNTKTSTVTINVANIDTTAPNAPTSLTASAANSTTVNLSWTASTDKGDNQTGVVKYNVLRGGVVIAQPTTTSYSDTTAVANTSYSYTVQAVDGAGNASTNSSIATVKTPVAADTTAPTLPTGLKASAVSTSQINLSWTASTDKGGSGLAGYNIYRDGQKLNSTLISATSYGDTTVTAGKTYSYKVQAVDGSGNKSAQTAAVSATTPTAIRGDITGPSGAPNGKIDLPDVSYVIRNYNTSDNRADISGPNGQPDRKVDIYDLSYIIRNYGK